MPKEIADSFFLKPFSSGVAAFFLQPLNIPAINFLNYVYRNPDIKIGEARKKFFGTGQGFFDKKARKERIFRGGLGRSIYSCNRYFLNFLLLELYKKWETPEAEVSTQQRLVK